MLRALTCSALLGGCATAAEAPPPAPAPVPVAAAPAPPPPPAPNGKAKRGPLTSGEPAPDLSLKDLESGATWTLSAHLDPTGASSPKGFMLAFMASWCGICTTSLPTLVELEKANPDLLVVVVSLDTDARGHQAELAKVRKAGHLGPVLAGDAQTATTWTGSERSVPKYMFVRHDGVLVAQDHGYGEDVKRMMPKQILRALAD